VLAHLAVDRADVDEGLCHVLLLGLAVEHLCLDCEYFLKVLDSDVEFHFTAIVNRMGYLLLIIDTEVVESRSHCLADQKTVVNVS